MKYLGVVRLVNEILEHYTEATIRQIYYRLVSPPYQYMENTKSMYTSFDGMLTRAREEGLIDWRKIADHTRNTIVPPGEFYEDTEEFIQSFKYNISSWWERYQVGLWENQNCLVKAFVEKDALCQVVADAALDYQVCVIPGRGYNSVTQLMKLAEELENIDKTIIILYFGDFDPTGLDIDRSAAERLARYSQADIKLKRIALTESDIAGLPHNPTKSTDTRAPSYIEKYGERCWELDALPPDVLRARVRAAIESCIDVEIWADDKKQAEQDKQEMKFKIETLKVDDL